MRSALDFGPVPEDDTTKAPEIPQVERPAMVAKAVDPRPFTPPEGMLDFADYPAMRSYFLDRVAKAMAEAKPVHNDRYQLAVTDVSYTGSDPSAADEERAMREGRTLSKRLTGKYELTDLATGQKTMSNRRTLMNVPWMSRNGFYVINGVPYAFAHQFRMDPGIYARTTADGIAEAQFNVAQGTGIPFKVQLDPQSGVFAARVAGHNIPLYHLLHTMGVDDNAMRDAWGAKLFETNRTKKPHSSAVSWLGKAILREKARLATLTGKAPEAVADAAALNAYFGRMQLDPETTRRLMGTSYDRVTPEALVHSSIRVLNVANKREDGDSRDNPSNQRIYDEGDHLATYLGLDRGGVFRTALWKLRNDPARLARIPSGLFDQHIGHHINGSGLAQVLEQINPLDAMTQAHRVTRLGEGAISSLDSAPDSSREVMPGFFAMIDPIKAPECLPGNYRVLTASGWKEWSSVEASDRFLVRLPDDTRAYAPANRLIAYEYAGSLYCAATGGREIYAVTGDHRVWYREVGGEWRFGFARNIHRQEIELDLGDGIARVRPHEHCLREYAGTVHCAEVPGGMLYIQSPDGISSWTGNSLRIGLDNYLARSVVKGPDNRIYTRLRDTRTGKEAWLNPIQMESEFVADPGALQSTDRFIPAISAQHGLRYMPKDKVRYELLSGDDLFTAGADSIPLKSGVKGMRQLMGCVSGDTVLCVRRETGQVQVVRAANYEFAAGDCMVSVDESTGLQEWVPVRAVRRDRSGREMRIVQLRSGRCLRTTDIHRWSIRCGDRFESILAMDIAPGHQVPVSLDMPSYDQSLADFVSGRCIIWDDVVAVQRSAPEPEVFDFDLGDRLFAAANGILTHNSKFLLHALPLEGGEAPLVQTPSRDGTPSFEFLGRYAGAVRSPVDGTVKDVDSHGATIVGPDGQETRQDWYDWVPFARKTYLEQKAVVKPGDKVAKGGLLAKSNFTDANGSLANGRNLRVGFMGYRGYNFEDAVVISQGAADKLTSKHMYTHDFEPEKGIEASRKRFVGLFPAVYTKEQLAGVGPDGVVRPGTELRTGDPIVLAVGTKSPSQSTMGRRIDTDKSEIWDHEEPGIVRDVVKTRDGVRVYVESRHPMRVGDKLAGAAGNKGTVAVILPDEDMPHDSQGRPLELLISPLGIPSRVNPSLVVTSKLAKVADKTGIPYVLGGFSDDDFVEFAAKELEKHGVPDTEDLTDPQTGKTIPGVGTGIMHVYKMQQEAEAKGHARETGGYSADDEPTRGGGAGSKHFGSMEQASMLSSGATAVLADLKTIHGQANPDFWRIVKLGGTPAIPRTPAVYDKFKALIRASGVSLQEGTDVGDKVFAATDSDIRELTGDRKIASGETYDRNMTAVKGGLFDPQATGSTGAGDRFAYIPLPEPMLNPLMEPVARHLLGLRAVDLDDIQTGRKPVNGKRGGEALLDLLSKVRPADVVKEARDTLKNSGSASKRDAAAKRLMYAQAMVDRDVSPADFMMTRVPVLPPKFRRIVQQGERTVVPDLNYLYRRLIQANGDLEASRDLGTESEADAREQSLHAYRALVGTEPPQDKELQQKRVGGVLQLLTGRGSPKYGFAQRKAIEFNVDLTGLGVAVPNPRLKLDELGIPEDFAWSVFGPFVIRRMVQGGRGAMEAARAVKERSAPAKEALRREMDERPVLLNRAPTLHRYGIMAFRAHPVAGKAIQVNPQITGPYGLDFDGDQQISTIFIGIEENRWEQLKSDPKRVMLHGRPATWWLARYHSTMEYTDMSYTDTGAVAFKRMATFVCDLEDFPVPEGEGVTREHVTQHELPDGLYVLAYDEERCRVVPAKAAYWSVHKDRAVQTVDLLNGMQIVTDDDPRAVYGLDTETFEMVRRRPSESVGIMVPVAMRTAGGAECDQAQVLRLQRGARSKETVDYIGLDRNAGYFLGALAGDGWIAENRGVPAYVSFAVTDAGINDKLREIVAGWRDGEISEVTFGKDSVSSSYGESSRITISSRPLAELFAPLVGHGADNKHLPPFFMHAGEEFRLGLVAGLMDTDGTVCVCQKGSRMQTTSAFQSNSLRLVREFQHLLRSLQVRSRITASKTPAGRRCWMLAISFADFQALPLDLRHTEKRQAFASAPPANTDSSAYNRTQRVPVSGSLISALRQFVSYKDKETKPLYEGLSTASKVGGIARSIAVGILARVPATFEHPHLDRFKRMVEDLGVSWEPVKSWEDTGMVETGYDLTVPGYETFMSVDGIVLSNTQSFTVPVSQQAVQQAYARMLPSRNLVSRHSGQPHYAPTQEPHEGLYLLTKAPQAKPVRSFPSKAAMVAALNRGEIGPDDPIRIEAAVSE